MDRRAFIGTLTGAILATPLAAEAQQAGKVYRVGHLFEQAEAEPILKIYIESLRDLGYVEGKNLVVERRFAAFNHERLPELAADLVRLKPDAIVTASNPVLTVALKQATMTIPIVFVGNADPVGDRLVTNVARPGGNVTGLSMAVSPEFAAKQLEILNETVPKLSRVAILRQAGFARVATDAAIKSAARKLGLTVLFVEVRTSTDIEGAFATMTRSRAGAVLTQGGGMTYVNRQRIADQAVRHGLPGIHLLRDYAEAGLLLTYGPSLEAMWRRAAIYVDKILKGAKPAELPIEQPTTFELVINLKTARALGLTIPPSLLQRADQVIE